MIDIKIFRENPDTIIKGLKKRGTFINLEKIQSLDSKRLSLLKESENLKSEKNVASEKIGELKKRGEKAENETLRVKEVSLKIKELDNELKDLSLSLDSELLMIPNIPKDSVPEGRSEEDNVEVRKSGDIKKYSFKTKSHQEIGEHLDILDFKRGTKLSGSGFSIFKDKGAALERALINFMMDFHVKEHGYTEISPPFVVNSESLLTTGNLPKFKEDLYKVEDENLFLIPTAEVPVTNIYRKEILEEKDLPLKYVAYTPCFRREAGSWGQETKGLIRQHQFDKVELVQFVKPEESEEALEGLLVNAEEILNQLRIPYRTIKLCGGDMGFSSALTYDIEVWLPSQEKYREISSCSCFTDFQARRGEIRYRPKDGGKPKFVHTVNGSGLAVGRTLVAVLENYQNEDGSVTVPEVLRPYLGGLDTIK